MAWHSLSWEPVAFSEIEKFPSAVLAHHYPDVPNWGDMTRFQEWPDATVDVLVGGTPCQSFSVAGLRKGLADPRGNLALTYLAIADKYRPTWLVWENVPGVLSADGGRAFGAILGGMGKLGYGFAYRVLDAQYVRTRGFPGAVPQRRRRVFVVAYLGDWRRAAAVLFDPESLSGNPPPGREAGQAAPTIPSRITAGGGLGTDFDCDGGCVAHSLRAEGFDASEDRTGRGTPIVPECADPIRAADHKGIRQDGKTGKPYNCIPSVANPLTHRMHKGINTTLDEGQTPIPVAFAQNTRDEVRMLGGDGKIAGALAAEPGMKQQTYTAIQNATRGKDQNGLGINADGSMYTLDQGSQHGVAQPVAFSCKDYGADAGESAPTLRAMGHDGSHANAGGQVAVAYGFKRGQGDKAGSLGYQPGVSPTLTGVESGTQNPPGVAFGWSEELTAHENVGATLQRGGDGGRHDGVMTPSMAVRRLTPVECERLQGFPDNFTRIPWRGKEPDDCPDGPRYKALGNSMAVNCMEWLGQRIQMVSELEQAA